MEGDNRPLALNPWVADGPNSYTAAIDAVNKAIDPERDSFLASNIELTQFMQHALYDRITSQSQANYEQFKRVEPHLSAAHEPYIQGDMMPSDLVLFLYATRGLESIEIARRTHHDWNVYTTVDEPIRKNLDQNPILYTNSIKSDPLYRIKNLNIINHVDDYYAQVDRKRTVRQHFGGKVLTIVRKSLVLHNHNGKMPREVRQHIREEREKVLNDRRAREKDSSYNYDKHSMILYDHLEDHILNTRVEKHMSWAVPILTNYYSVKRRYVKADQLLKFDTSSTQEVT